eukprot:1900821-Rhodomonas_salina.1
MSEQRHSKRRRVTQRLERKGKRGAYASTWLKETRLRDLLSMSAAAPSTEIDEDDEDVRVSVLSNVQLSVDLCQLTVMSAMGVAQSAIRHDCCGMLESVACV